MKIMDVQPKIAVSKGIREDENTSLAVAGSFHLCRLSKSHSCQSGNMAPIVFELITRKRV